MGKITPQALLQQSKKKKGPARISFSTIISCNVVVIFVVLSFYAAYRHWHKRTDIYSEINENENFEATRGRRRSMKFELSSHAILNTSKGCVAIEFYKNGQPGAVERFVTLCEDGHFKGTLFHHVVRDQVLAVGKDRDLEQPKGWTLKTESDIHLGSGSKYEPFMLATSKAGLKNGQEFELFLTVAPVSDSNDDLVVFGRVLRGENVIQEAKAAEDSIQNCLVGSSALL